MKYAFVLKRTFILLLMLIAFTSAKRASKGKPRPLPLASVHIVDRNGFSETISNKDRLSQFQKVNFLNSQPYQKVLRVYARDSKGNVRSIVTSYHDNGNPKQFLEIVNGRALGSYREWHENGMMSSSNTVISGMADITQAAEHSWLFDGPSYAWDEENNLLAEINYSQGVLEGTSNYYHANGQVWKCIPYSKGQVEGIAEIYKDTGDLLQQTYYVQGLKHGPAIRYWDACQIASQEEYMQGKLEKGQYLDKKGILISEVKQGTGYRVTFGKESFNEFQEYRCGTLEGEVRVYTQQGQLKRVYHVKDNIKHGEEIEYYQSPNMCMTDLKPRICFNWYEGKVHGPVKTWYSNGSVESQREMCNNKRNGISTVWYRDGNLMMIEEYDQDKIVRGEYFKKGERTATSQVMLGKGTVTIFDAEGLFVQKISYENGNPDQ